MPYTNRASIMLRGETKDLLAVGKDMDSWDNYLMTLLERAMKNEGKL